MSDLIRALNELREACDEYDLAESFYYGRREEQFAGRLLSRYFRGTGTKFSVNFAGRPVDAVLDRLEITAVTADNAEATQALNDFIWSGNQLDIEAPEVIKNALIFGDAYLYIGSGDGDDEVEVWYNSPKTVRVFYDEENPRKKSYAIKAWAMHEEESNSELIRVNLYYPNRIEKYVSLPGTKGTSDSDFVAWTDDLTDENGYVENETGEVPFFHFRTARKYGRPEHENAFGPQDALTKLVMSQMTSSEFAVFPQRYAIEEPSGETMDDIDFGDEDESDVPGESQNGSQFKAGPGNLWLLRNIKSMGEFSAANAQNFLEPMNWYVRSMSSSCSTPLHYFDPVGDAPSGESLRALEAPLIKKVRARQVSFAATWREALMYALKLLGVSSRQVNIQWSNPQVIDDLQGWQAVNEKITAGVPKWQALMEAGYTEQQVRSWGLMNTTSEPDGSEDGQTDV